MRIKDNPQDLMCGWAVTGTTVKGEIGQHHFLTSEFFFFLNSKWISVVMKYLWSPHLYPLQDMSMETWKSLQTVTDIF